MAAYFNAECMSVPACYINSGDEEQYRLIPLKTNNGPKVIAVT